MRPRQFAIVGCLFALCDPVWANNSLVVNTALDGHDVNGCTPAVCTLRDAIDAVAPAGGTTITFALPLPATIQLQNGTGLGALEINKPLILIGPGTALLSIAAPGNNRAMNVNTSQVLMSSLTIRSGAVTATSPYGASGGCIYVTSAGGLILDGVDVRDCSAQAANGSPGALGGYGTPGGPGGNAFGGAIYVTGGGLELLNSSVTNSSAAGGSGGTGADGDPNFFTSAGDGGAGGIAAGGGIYVASGAGVHIENSTIASNTAHAGWGGDAGSDTFGTFAGGGPGGDASGGLIFVANSSSADAEFTTLSDGVLLAGQGGAGGPGNDGSNGATHGSAIYAVGAIATAADAIVGAQAGVAQCEGAVAAAIGTANLDEDSSCGFTLHDTFANLFRPLDISTATLPGFMPTWHSKLIDAAASCMDLMPAIVSKDQHDTHRPQGAQCDLGAIEADYVFVDGLE